MKTVVIIEDRKCDFCSTLASYDAKTKMGPWANMCKECFKKYGLGVGVGIGQELIKQKCKDK